MQLAKFGGTPQQAMSVKTQNKQKTIWIYSRTSGDLKLLSTLNKMMFILANQQFLLFSVGLQKKKKSPVWKTTKFYVSRVGLQNKNKKRSSDVANNMYRQMFRFGKIFLLPRWKNYKYSATRLKWPYDTPVAKHCLKQLYFWIYCG